MYETFLLYWAIGTTAIISIYLLVKLRHWWTDFSYRFYWVDQRSKTNVDSISKCQADIRELKRDVKELKETGEAE